MSLPRSTTLSRALPVLALAFVAAPALFWRGSYVDVEALGLLRKYWSDRTLLEKIFDVGRWDFYRGRELSYVFDFLDARWIRSLLDRDVVFFLAPSAVLASLALVALARFLAPRALPALDRATRWLCVLVLLSNFVFLSTMGMLYRATKPLVAPLLLGLLLLVVAEFRHPRLGPRAGGAAVFGVALLMSLLDRQGLFYVLMLLTALGLAWILTRRGRGLFLGAAAAVGVWWVYNDLLGPRIVHAVTGYWPDMSFQQVRPSQLLQPQAWEQAVVLLGDWTSVLLGGLPPQLIGASAAGLAAAWGWSERHRPRRVVLAGVVGLGAVVAQVAMVALMVQRHPPVTWVGNRLWYYPLPYQALVVFGLLWGCERLTLRRGGSLPRVVPFALAALVVANVAQWPEQRVRMHEMPAFEEQLRRSSLLAGSLRGRWAAPLLDGDYRRFYFECLDRFPRLASRARTQAGEGLGVDIARVRHGRVAAWAGRESQIIPRTAESGRHVLAGAVLLRPGERVSILLGARQRRLVGEVRNDGARESVEFFRVEADLREGRTDVRLESRLPEREIPDKQSLERAGFAILLPVAVWPKSPAR
ncbi:MAG: hypothetical protein LJF30_08780 [Acidobacteria bacterium]|nr:hypothetical protein [Acidobacteriota bacterium]